MEHATALVDHDATPNPNCPAVYHGERSVGRCICAQLARCSCRKLAAAGWAVRCHACGSGFTAGGPSRFAHPDLDFAGVEVEDRIRHRGDRMAEADDGYDVLRDAELVDAAERRVA